jgi:hypothetical protein
MSMIGTPLDRAERASFLASNSTESASSRSPLAYALRSDFGQDVGVSGKGARKHRLDNDRPKSWTINFMATDPYFTKF